MKADKPEGLRERKKQRTRLAISQVATRLFIERGFAQVTISDIAEASEVSVNTVFNYFASKEELFFDRGAELVETMVALVRDRRAGETPVAALRRRIRETLHSELPRGSNIKAFMRTIDASPELQAHAQRLFERAESELAQVLESEAPRKDAPRMRALAAMMVGLIGLLLREYRRALIAGVPAERRKAELWAVAREGLGLLEPAP